MLPAEEAEELARIALAAPVEPIYQYRIRNGYNGQVTAWQTIKRDHVDFVLKAQPHNAEFQIIAPLMQTVSIELRNRLKAEGLAELVKDARENAPLTADQWETLTNNWVQTFLGLSSDHDACRAAMLQGADGNSPMIPDGWVLVPLEPTEDMIVNGFESEPDESFSDEKEWEAYDAMSGCQQASHRAKLCWEAMIAAAMKIDISKM